MIESKTLLCHILAETLTRVREANPFGETGVWMVKKLVWVDVSSIATGVALETSGTVFEYACWMCPTNDAQHINLAEVNAVLKGVNMALQ